ncbi:FUSC family protein [Acidiphilium multivorum]|uniref:FUSC family protein n=1 Tax=Acidiphilium multivorum TaxID=62140 RepID=UPI0039C90031
MGRGINARDIAFVFRCSATATIAYALASSLGLAHPVWASISGIIVSQERLDQTKSAVLWRFAGTIVGIVVAILAGGLIASTGLGVAIQTGVSVAVCAGLVRRWPDLKVAMWTAPIVFFDRDTGGSLLMVGYWRGSEVILGGLVGTALHLLAEKAIARLERARPDDSL